MAAIAYYAERDPAVARRFVAVVEDAIERIVQAPNRWRILEGDVRRCLTRVFPYGALYSIERDSVLILAVMTAVASPVFGGRAGKNPNTAMHADAATRRR